MKKWNLLSVVTLSVPCNVVPKHTKNLMSRKKLNRQILLLAFIVGVFVGCNDAVTTEAVETPVAEIPVIETNTIELVETPLTETPTIIVVTIEETATPTPTDTATPIPDPVAKWLEGVRAGSIEAVNIDTRIHWAVGYFLYYGTVEGIGIDNLIYNALESYRRLGTGEVTLETQSRGDKNLMAIADTLNYSPTGSLVDQIGQTAQIRAEILEHVVESQHELTPEEALASGNVVGMIAPPAPKSKGEKFLVYKQVSADGEFEFVGVVVSVDTAGHGNTGNSYSDADWDNLRWLGDATGPFWTNLPVSAASDPTNLHEARLGVLLINEVVFEEIIAGERE